MAGQNGKSRCPDCGTAELTHGHRVCQACGVLQLLGTSGRQPGGTYRQVTYLPPTPPAFGRAARRAREREREAG
jgi:ribosomal protein L32